MNDLYDTLNNIETIKAILKKWNVPQTVMNDVMFYAKQTATRQLNEKLGDLTDNLVDGLNTNERQMIEKPAPSGRYANKIPVIKLVRERTRLGLAEAKWVVDNYLYKRNLFNTAPPNPDHRPYGY